MANQWFRVYGEFATDPKVQMLSEADQRRYIMALCLRCSNGDVTLHDDEVAFQLRISNEEWARTKAVLVAKELIDEDNKPTKWDKRQYVADSSAERVSRHREKKKQACNVTVTPPDTETDTETESKPDSLRESSPLAADERKADEKEKSVTNGKSVTFKTWLANIKAKGERAVSDYKPLWDYCETVKLPAEWVEIAWAIFVKRYTKEEKAKKKRYIDWRRVFLRVVEENWLRLWYYSEKDGQFRLTTAGITADMTTREDA